MAGTTNYPGGLDVFPDIDGDVDHMNDSGVEGGVIVGNLQSSVAAMQAELGINPSGGAATVAARLDAANSGAATVNTLTPATSVSVPSSDQMQVLVMDQDTTINLPAVVGGYSFTLKLSGAFTPTWAAPDPGSSIQWADGTPPAYASPAVYVFTTFESGAPWLAAHVGSAFA